MMRADVGNCGAWEVFAIQRVCQICKGKKGFEGKELCKLFCIRKVSGWTLCLCFVELAGAAAQRTVGLYRVPFPVRSCRRTPRRTANQRGEFYG